MTCSLIAVVLNIQTQKLRQNPASRINYYLSGSHFPCYNYRKIRPIIWKVIKPCLGMAYITPAQNGLEKI